MQRSASSQIVGPKPCSDTTKAIPNLSENLLGYNCGTQKCLPQPNPISFQEPLICLSLWISSLVMLIFMLQLYVLFFFVFVFLYCRTILYCCLQLLIHPENRSVEGQNKNLWNKGKQWAIHRAKDTCQGEHICPCKCVPEKDQDLWAKVYCRN